MSPEEINNLTQVLKRLDEILATRPSEWVPFYSALGGTIVGSITYFLHTFFLERRREKKNSNNVLAALLAEISAVLEVIKYRKYHTAIKKVIDDLDKSPPGTTYPFSICVPDHYSRIYQANTNIIGVIDKSYAKKIVTFHQLIDAVVQDVKLEGIISKGANIEAFKEMEQIFSKAITIGNKLVLTKDFRSVESAPEH